jgi:TRAP-type C4-dicarboxylate transport system permease small subunit
MIINIPQLFPIRKGEEKMNRTIGSIYKKGLDYVIITIFVMMFIVVLLNVICRYVFNNSLPWAMEFSRYSFIWIIFLGSALAMRNGSHIGLQFFEKILSVKYLQYYKLFINLLNIIFLLIFTVVGFIMAFQGTHTYSAVIQMPMFIPYLALPFGGVAMLIEAINIIKSMGNNLKDNHTEF